MTDKRPIKRHLRPAPLAAVLLLSALMCSPAAAKKEKLPEVSEDGLHLLNDSRVAIVYAKPGVTLDHYTRLKLLDCFVDFKKDWQRDYNMNELGLGGRVGDMDAERIKKDLAARFEKIFSEELTRGGYQITDEVGPDVLLVRPALINVDVAAPDIPKAGTSRTWVRSAGAMTLYMELYDSATSTLLARVVDPQADNQSGAGTAMPSSKVTNVAAADRILRRWAELLARHLGEVEVDTSSR